MAAPAPHSSPAKLSTALRLFLALALSAAALNASHKWPAIDKAELADTKPKVDPDAGAEILLREITLDHGSVDASEDTYYVRAKIYAQSGIDEFSKVELPYDDKTSVHYIAARTIKPDGTIVELNSKDIFDRMVVKTGNIRVKVKSFAMPALEPGCIVEYTYTETVDGPGWYMPMYFQTTLPARRVHYKVKLLTLPYESAIQLTVRTMNFNCSQQSLTPDKNNWFHFEMTNLAAAKDEPFQPPQINNLSSMLLYYALKDEGNTPAEYWGHVAKKLDEELDDTAKPNKAIRTALETIVAKDDNEAAKLRKIYSFCRTKIVNRYSDTSGFTDKQREKLKENKSASDVLKNGNGGHDDINSLFAALVRAAGLEAHYAACNDRTEIYFSPSLTDVDYVLRDKIVAVRVAGQWQFFDPGSSYLPYGLLNWWDTDTSLLIGDKTGKSQPIASPSAPAEASQTRRTAKFKLSEDGTLEGDVVVDYIGYSEIYLKRELDGKTTTERETYLREDLQEYQKLAELTDIKVENAASPTEPLKISYHLRVPQYADSTGSRLFLQAAFFQKGRPPWFDAATRRTAIFFNHRYIADDVVDIEMPAGYMLEEASAPAHLELGALGEYTPSLGVIRRTNSLRYARKFKLNWVAFPAKLYPPIKQAFESIHEQDAHVVTLKLKETPDVVAPAKAVEPAAEPAAPPSLKPVSAPAPAPATPTSTTP